MSAGEVAELVFMAVLLVGGFGSVIADLISKPE